MEKHEITIEHEWMKNQVVPMVYHETCVQRYINAIKWILIGAAITVVLIVGAFVALWMQYDYVSSAEYSGVYNVVDSEGNVVTSDLSPDDVIRIMQELNGAGKNN